MRRRIAIACVLAMISGGVLAQQSGAQAPAPQKTHAPAKKKPTAPSKNPVPFVAPYAPAPAQFTPPVPATLMNSAPVNSNVTMKNGLLTIDAPNSMLSEVLSGVHQATGAVVEGTTPDERIAVRLGPGNPRQVIAALLEGTAYDYVILGSQERQDAVTRIVLTQPSGKDTPGAENPPQASRPQPPESTFSDRTPADDAGSAQPAGEIQTDQTEQPPQPQPNMNQPKTPEQLFKDSQPPDQQKPPQ